jgi:hypothetical protein
MCLSPPSLSSRYRRQPSCLRRRQRGLSFPQPLLRGACAGGQRRSCKTGPAQGSEPVRSALHFVVEHGNGRQIAAGAGRAGEQRAAGDREILLAALAAEAQRDARAAGFVSLYGAQEGKPERRWYLTSGSA